MRVGLYTARYLGEAVANIVHASGANIVARNHTAAGWWGTAGTPHTDDVFAAHPDIVVSCLTDHIFTPDEIKAVPLGIVNLHPAPLPEYRGCNSYSHAIINGDTSYRVTLHRVDEGIDTGPIIRSSQFTIHQDDTARTLHDRAQVVAATMFASWWHAITRGDPTALRTKPQAGTPRYYRRNSLDAYRNLAEHPTTQRHAIRRALTFPPFPAPIEAP